MKYFKSKIDYALNTNRQFQYSEIVDYHEMMNHLFDEVSRCPAALNQFPEVNFYTTELSQARDRAAEEHYNAALGYEKIYTRDSWKDAYYHFQQADCYVPGYKDVSERMINARFYATLKVIVEQIRVPKNYQLSSDFFLNQVVAQRKFPGQFT